MSPLNDTTASTAQGSWVKRVVAAGRNAEVMCFRCGPSGSEAYRRALALLAATADSDEDGRAALLEGMPADAADLSLALADVGAAVLESVSEDPGAWVREALRRVLEGENGMHEPPQLT